MLRDNRWLVFRLNDIWDKYFTDVKQINKVYVRFGKYSNTRFGSIKLRYSDSSTHVIITKKFCDQRIPEEIVDHTIAHELVHYSHGFSSPYPRLHKYPHRGGLIEKELTRRGLGYLVDYYKKWVTGYTKSLNNEIRR